MKVYVEVLVWYTAEGRVVPVSFLWEDGRRYQIERVKNVQRCASRKEGRWVRDHVHLYRAGERNASLF